MAKILIIEEREMEMYRIKNLAGGSVAHDYTWITKEGDALDFLRNGTVFDMITLDHALQDSASGRRIVDAMSDEQRRVAIVNSTNEDLLEYAYGRVCHVVRKLDDTNMHPEGPPDLKACIHSILGLP